MGHGEFSPRPKGLLASAAGMNVEDDVEGDLMEKFPSTSVRGDKSSFLGREGPAR